MVVGHDPLPDTDMAMTTIVRRQAALIRAKTGCDIRTAEKAVLHGLDAVRSGAVREAIRDAIAELQADPTARAAFGPRSLAAVGPTGSARGASG